MIYLKSSSEIDIIRANGMIIVEIFDRLEEYIKPGITTKDVDKIVENVIYSQSAIASFKGYKGWASTLFPASACVSVNDVVVHGIPSDLVLQDGDIVSVDVGVFKNGFHADAARTYCVGDVSDEAKRLIEYTKQSFFEGIKEIAPQKRLSDISHAIQKYVESGGYSVVRDLVGHGIGRSLHEAPAIPNYGAAGKGPKLRAGMVLAIEPMVNAGSYNVKTLADGWTVVSSDSSLSAHYENTVAVTRDGCSILTLRDN